MTSNVNYSERANVHRLDTTYCSCDACELRREYHDMVVSQREHTERALSNERKWASILFVFTIGLVITLIYLNTN